MAMQDPLRHYWLFPSGTLVDAGDIEHAGYVRKYPARFRLTPRQVSRDLDKHKLVALAIRSSGAVAITRTVPRGFERLTLTGAFKADPGILRKAASVIEYEGWPGDVDAWDVGGSKVRMLATNPARDRFVIRSGRNPLLMVVPNVPKKRAAPPAVTRLYREPGDPSIYVQVRFPNGKTGEYRVPGELESKIRRMKKRARGKQFLYVKSCGKFLGYEPNPSAKWHKRMELAERARAKLADKQGLLGQGRDHRLFARAHAASLAASVSRRQRKATYTKAAEDIERAGWSGIMPNPTTYKSQLAQARKERAALERKRQAHVRDLERRWAKIASARAKANPGTDMGSIARTADFQKGLKLYRQIHGCDPKSVKRTILRLGPGDNKVTGRVVLVGMGKAPAESYEPPKGSQKAGRIWVHPYSQKPEKVVTVDGKTIITLPGTHGVRAGADGEAWIHG